MVRLCLIEQVGYREWTESLGNDREWIIQIAQADFYGRIQKEASRLGAFALPLRHDYIVVLTTSLTREEHEQIFDTARMATMLPLRAACVSHNIPKKALDNAHRILGNTSPGELSYMEGHDGLTVVAHFDVNGITRKTRGEGLASSLEVINSTFHRLGLEALRLGGIPQYLGGDNVLVVLPDEGYESIVERLLGLGELKVGVGVSVKPRRSLMLATRALTRVRHEPGAGRLQVEVG